MALRNVPCWIVRALIILGIAFCLAMLFRPVPVRAAPKAQSVEQCAMAQDIALVARSLAIEGIEREKADAILKRIYIPVDDVGRTIIRLITDASFRSSVSPTEYADTLAQMCVTRGGDAAFVAQLAHETGAFRWLKEIWGPTEQQLKYERHFEAAWPPTPLDTRNRVAFALGNSEPGDGKRWLGRGGIQTTGQTNTVRVLASLDLALDQPEVLEQPEAAIRSSGFFWKTHGMSAKANAKRFSVISAGVNGMFREFRPGDLDRYGFYEAVCAALGLTDAENVA